MGYEKPRRRQFRVWLTQCSYKLGGGEQEERGRVEVTMDSLHHESEQGKLCDTHRDRLVYARHETFDDAFEIAGRRS
jgi:hypothetical protein